MAETTQANPAVRKIDWAWVAIPAIPLLVALADPELALEAIRFAVAAIGKTAPFILFAVAAVAWLKATGAERLLARAFEGREVRMIVVAALLGGLSPFCSCEVIPFVAAMLAVGAPLSAVMAFWLASPLMDPAMYAITAGTLGFGFATAKAAFAIALGLFGGLGTMAFGRSALFADPLRAGSMATGCGCGTQQPFEGQPVWSFWRLPERRTAFAETGWTNLLFLTKWLTLAYLVEALMLAWVPAEAVASLLGGDGPGPVLLAATVGAPAYLNGFAAIPLVDALLQQGMSQGAAMAFVLAGGVSCIPAALAVWALVKPRVFTAYLGFAFVGSVIAGLSWGLIATA